MPIKNRIQSLGLEVEGAWDVSSMSRLTSELHHDGSVQGMPAGTNIGELSSPVIKGIDTAVDWLKSNYPDHVNDSCGFHVHVGLSTVNYSRLMDESFWEFFQADMQDFWEKNKDRPTFALFKSRLDGRNRYCQKKFRPEEQMTRTETYGDTRTHPRYSQLNYCFTRHGTLECRLFPCFQEFIDAKKALLRFYDGINIYLSRLQADPEMKKVISVPVRRKVESVPVFVR